MITEIAHVKLRANIIMTRPTNVTSRVDLVVAFSFAVTESSSHVGIVINSTDSSKVFVSDFLLDANKHRFG